MSVANIPFDPPNPDCAYCLQDSILPCDEFDFDTPEYTSCICTSPTNIKLGGCLSKTCSTKTQELLASYYNFCLKGDAFVETFCEKNQYKQGPVGEVVLKYCEGGKFREGIELEPITSVPFKWGAKTAEPTTTITHSTTTTITVTYYPDTESTEPPMIKGADTGEEEGHNNGGGGESYYDDEEEEDESAAEDEEDGDEVIYGEEEEEDDESIGSSPLRLSNVVFISMLFLGWTAVLA